MMDAGVVFLRLMGLWALAGGVLGLHGYRARYSRHFLYVLLGGLAVFDLMQIGLIGPLVTAGVAAESGIVMGSLFSPRMIMPVIYFAVLLIYASEGTLQAALLIPGMLLASLVGGLFLPYVFTAGVPLVEFVFTPLTQVSLGMALRQQVAELSTFMVGVYVLVVVYQLMANRISRKRLWIAAGGALLITAWTHAVIYAVGAQWGSPRWTTILAVDLAGWSLSALALIPWVLVYFLGREHVSGALRERVDDRRPALDLVRDTLALQTSLRHQESQIHRLDEALELLLGARRVIQSSRDTESLMRRICQLLIGRGKYSRVWIGLLADRKGELYPIQEASAQEGAGQSDRWWQRVQLLESRALREAFRKDTTMLHAEGDPNSSGEDFPFTASIPMHVDQGMFGIMVVHTPFQDTLDHEELRLLRGVAETVGHGLRSLRRETQHVRTLKELDVIRRLIEEMISKPDQSHFLTRSLEHVVNLLDASCGWIYLIANEGRSILCHGSYGTQRDWAGERLQVGEGAAGTVAAKKKAFLVEDYQSWEGSIPQAAGEGIATIMGVPMLWLHQIHGVVLVARRQHEPGFTQADKDLLQLFANQATMVYQNARLVQAAESRARQLAALNDLVRQALAAENLAELAAALPRALQRTLNLKSCAIASVHPDDSRIVELVVCGQNDSHPRYLDINSGPPPFDDGIIGANPPQLFERSQQGDVLRQDLVKELDAERVMAMPLEAAGKRLGFVFWGLNTALSGDHLSTCRQAMGSIALALTKVQAFQREKKRRDVLEALREANLKLTSSLALQPVLEAILEQTLALFRADDAHIFLYDNEKLSFGAAMWRDAPSSQPFSHPREDGLTYAVARSNERIVISNVNQSPLFENWKWGGAIVGLPLRIEDTVVGVMNVAMAAPHTFTDDELRTLELLADQASIALHNARLFERIDADHVRMSLLYDVSREIAQTLDEDAILKRAICLSTEGIGALEGAAFLLDGDSGRLTLKVLSNSESRSAEELDEEFSSNIATSSIDWLENHDRSTLLNNLNQEDHWTWYEGDSELQSAMSVPIRSEGKTIGVLSLVSDRIFQQDQLALFEAVSHQVGLALSNARKYHQAQRRLAELGALQRVARTIANRVEVEPLLHEVVEQTRKFLGYELVEVFLLEDDQLVRYAAQGGTQRTNPTIPLDQGVIGRVVRKDEAAFLPDVALDPDYLCVFPDTRAEIAVPLHASEQLVGVLNVETSQKQGLTENDLRLLSLLADQVSVALENANLYDQLRRHTVHLEHTVAERTAALAKALERAQESDRLKSQFVTDVSHELRTPLTNIRLYLELLRHGDPKRFSDYLQTLGRETDRLVVLIEDLLAISRLDTGASAPEPTLIDLNALAMSLVEDRRRLLAERNLVLEFTPSPELPRVKADEPMIAQAVSNLVTNAMNYTPAGGSIHIETKQQVEQGQTWATLKVEDTGLGIPELEQNRVFEPERSSCAMGGKLPCAARPSQEVHSKFGFLSPRIGMMIN